MNNNEFNPAEAITNAIEAVDSLSEQINNREEDCLKRIYTRFCLLKAKMVDFIHVKMKHFPERLNYWEYWYKLGTDEQYFLMSRELVIEDNIPKLNIIFSGELVKNNEL